MTMKRAQQQGFTLLEVLISMVILSIGLLGVAGMQANSLRNNNNAFIKTQASNLASDLADRIRANKSAKDNYTFNTDDDDTVDPGCISAGCEPGQMAAYDIATWSEQLTSLLPGGLGIVSVADNTATIKILWSDLQYSNSNGDAVTLEDPNDFCPEKGVDQACFVMGFNL